MTRRFFPAFACCLVVMLIITAVFISLNKEKPTEPAAEKFTIYTSIYPIYHFTKNICGEETDIHCLVPEGADFRTWEPSEDDIQAMLDADLFIYSGKGAEPWIEKILSRVNDSEVKVVNASQNITEESSTGYVWLNPLNALKQMTAIYNAVNTEDPQNKVIYKLNMDIFEEKIKKLDNLYKTDLSSLNDKTLYVTAPLYDNLCSAYGLTQSTISGIGYQGGVDFSKLQNIRSFLSSSRVKCIYTEPINDTYPLKELTNLTETTVGTLDPFIINLDESGYFNVMERNLLTIKKGQMPALYTGASNQS